MKGEKTTAVFQPLQDEFRIHTHLYFELLLQAEGQFAFFCHLFYPGIHLVSHMQLT